MNVLQQQQQQSGIQACRLPHALVPAQQARRPVRQRTAPSSPPPSTAAAAAAGPGGASGGGPNYGQPAKPAFPSSTGVDPASPAGLLDAQATSLLDKQQQVARLLVAKEASGKTFSQIAAEVGLTNVYCTQLFYRQQQLQPNTVQRLKAAVPALSDDDLAAMQRAPLRHFDPSILQEPAVYRLHEAITHGGEALKALLNEEFGDGIMSAIDMYATLDRDEGLQGERRVVVTFNGKFLPYVEQRVEDNVAQRKQE